MTSTIHPAQLTEGAPAPAPDTLPHEIPKNEAELKENAKALYARLRAFGMDDDGAVTVVGRYAVKIKDKLKEAEAEWVSILRLTLATLVEDLHDNGMEAPIMVQILPASAEPFEIKKGPDKGKTRHWRFHKVKKGGKKRGQAARRLLA